MPPAGKRLYLSTIGSRYEIEESSTARPTRGQGIDYGFVGTGLQEIAPMTVGEVNTRVVGLAELHERDTQKETENSMEWGRGCLCFPVAAWAIRSIKGLSQVTPPRSFRTHHDHERARQPGPEARIPDHQEASGDADSHIYGCAVENQVKFATCTLLGAALTWWNGQIRTLGPEAYAMTWEVLKRKMTDKYCPQGEIKKLEIELWNLKVKGNDVPAYTERFQELTLICTKFVANETEKVDKYLSGLPDNIYGNLSCQGPRPLNETLSWPNDMRWIRKLLTYAERQSDNKRRADDSSRNNHGHQQQPFKRQNVAKVYNMGTGERKPYGGSLPKCNKCHLHHNGPCTQRTLHKRDCSKTENKNEEEMEMHKGWVYAVGMGGKKREYRQRMPSLFMQQISTKKEEDKSKKRKDGNKIDDGRSLLRGTKSIAPSEMKELSNNYRSFLTRMPEGLLKDFPKIAKVNDETYSERNQVRLGRKGRERFPVDKAEVVQCTNSGFT
ncbi:putative reverse transcriptase domain-containing protein [Tanacetum coccineum]